MLFQATFFTSGYKYCSIKVYMLFGDHKIGGQRCVQLGNYTGGENSIGSQYTFFFLNVVRGTPC